jgi:isocitrate/isopropylmalate dehydrogenase
VVVRENNEGEYSNIGGENELGERLLAAVEETLESGLRTPDLGGKATTKEVTEGLIANLKLRI